MTGVHKHTKLGVCMRGCNFSFRLSQMVCGWVLEVNWSLHDVIYKCGGGGGACGSLEGKEAS